MERPSWTNIAIATAAAIGLGIGIYFLSKETSTFDPKGEHNLENLKIILNELHLEYTCIYARYYNMMLKMKEKEEMEKLPPQVVSGIEADLRRELEEKNKAVLSFVEVGRSDFKKSLDLVSLNHWTAYFKDDPEVKKLA
jgi:hypothetical protein